MLRLACTLAAISLRTAFPIVQDRVFDIVSMHALPCISWIRTRSDGHANESRRSSSSSAQAFVSASAPAIREHWNILCGNLITARWLYPNSYEPSAYA